MPQPLSTSTPVRSQPFQTQTVLKTCSSDTRYAEVRSLTSHECVVVNGVPARLTNNQGVVRAVSAVTRSDRQNHNQHCARDKLSDYEDVWSTPTPPGRLTSPPQPFSAVCSYRTIPSTTRRPPCGLDPARYQLQAAGEAATAGAAGSPARRSSPSVFRFDAPRRLTSQTNDVSDTQPSPIYAEPCDRLADGLRQRVAVRRVRCPPMTDTVTVATPPISASYKLPRDFLDFATKFSAEYHADTQGVQLPASLPDGRNAVLSPQVIVTPPSIVDDDDDDVASASTIEPDRLPCNTDSLRGRHGDRLKVRAAAAAAVRRQRRSNYDNVDDEEDVNDEDGRQPSRCTTVSRASARTEYSPPWEADRWRFLVDTADLQRCWRRDVVRNGQFCDPEAQRTRTLQQLRVSHVVCNMRLRLTSSC